MNNVTRRFEHVVEYSMCLRDHEGLTSGAAIREAIFLHSQSYVPSDEGAGHTFALLQVFHLLLAELTKAETWAVETVSGSVEVASATNDAPHFEGERNLLLLECWLQDAAAMTADTLARHVRDFRRIQMGYLGLMLDGGEGKDDSPSATAPIILSGPRQRVTTLQKCQEQLERAALYCERQHTTCVRETPDVLLGTKAQALHQTLRQWVTEDSFCTESLGQVVAFLGHFADQV